MKDSKDRGGWAWEKAGVILGAVGAVISILTSLAEKGPLIGSFLSIVTFYLGSIVISLYVVVFLFSAIGLVF